MSDLSGGGLAALATCFDRRLLSPAAAFGRRTRGSWP